MLDFVLNLLCSWLLLSIRTDLWYCRPLSVYFLSSCYLLQLHLQVCFSLDGDFLSDQPINHLILICNDKIIHTSMQSFTDWHLFDQICWVIHFILLDVTGWSNGYNSIYLKNRYYCDCNWTRTQNHLVLKQTLSEWVYKLNESVWVFIYELSGSGFESSCSHLTFRFRTCFEQEVPWHSGNYWVWINSKTRTWHEKNTQSDIIVLAINARYKIPL